MELSQEAPLFYSELEKRRPDCFLHISKILALVSEYGHDEVVLAMKNAMEMEAYGAEYIVNLLAARKRLRVEPSPIQLTYKTDLLDIDIEQADLSIYDQ